MDWKPMTVDELALYRQSDGDKLVKLDGVWWIEIRPFFFRPLFPFTEIFPGSKRYPLKAYAGGFLHVVPSGAPANATMNFFVHPDVQGYSLDSLNHRRRRITREGMQNFTAKVLTDLDEFIATAYEVYLSFYKRTGYSYRNERVRKEAFARWATNLFRYEKIRKLGAYHGDKLSAVEVSYLIDRVIVADTMFADDAGLAMKVTDFVLHTMREAAADTDARIFFSGLPTGVASLDEAKLLRGCNLLQSPACLRINPLALSVARVLLKTNYQKFLKITAPPVADRESPDLPGRPGRSDQPIFDRHK